MGRAWTRASTPSGIGARLLPVRPGGPVHCDGGALDQLRALGYPDGEQSGRLSEPTRSPCQRPLSCPVLSTARPDWCRASTKTLRSEYGPENPRALTTCLYGRPRNPRAPMGFVGFSEAAGLV